MCAISACLVLSLVRWCSSTGVGKLRDDPDGDMGRLEGNSSIVQAELSLKQNSSAASLREQSEGDQAKDLDGSQDWHRFLGRAAFANGEALEYVQLHVYEEGNRMRVDPAKAQGLGPLPLSLVTDKSGGFEFRLLERDIPESGLVLALMVPVGGSYAERVYSSDELRVHGHELIFALNCSPLYIRYQLDDGGNPYEVNPSSYFVPLEGANPEARGSIDIAPIRVGCDIEGKARLYLSTIGEYLVEGFGDKGALRAVIQRISFDPAAPGQYINIVLGNNYLEQRIACKLIDESTGGVVDGAISAWPAVLGFNSELAYYATTRYNEPALLSLVPGLYSFAPKASADPLSFYLVSASSSAHAIVEPGRDMSLEIAVSSAGRIKLVMPATRNQSDLQNRTVDAKIIASDGKQQGLSWLASGGVSPGDEVDRIATHGVYTSQAVAPGKYLLRVRTVGVDPPMHYEVDVLIVAGVLSEVYVPGGSFERR